MQHLYSGYGEDQARKSGCNAGDALDKSTGCWRMSLATAPVVALGMVMLLA